MRVHPAGIRSLSSDIGQDMTDKPKSQTTTDVLLCDWCGIPLGSANTAYERVCVRCYQRLSRANVSDEEIFGVARLNRTPATNQDKQ
jgi:hypothetical protein